jgi:hypothetical protein
MMMGLWKEEVKIMQHNTWTILIRCTSNVFFKLVNTCIFSHLFVKSYIFYLSSMEALSNCAVFPSKLKQIGLLLK